MTRTFFIILTIFGETDSTKKLLNLYWRLEFKDKASARIYFGKLKQLFSDVATNKKLEKGKDVGDMAQFSTRNPVDTGVRHITLFFGKSPMTKKYEIAVLFGSDFRDE